MKSLGPATTIHKNQLHSEWPFIWLYEVQVPGTPPTMYRLTNSVQQIIQQGNVFYPAPISHGGIRQNSDGDLPRIDFTLHNATLEVAPIVEANDGLVGAFVRIQFVSVQEVDLKGSGWVEEGEIVGVRMTESGLSFSVAAANLYRAHFPPFRYTRKKCRWLFGSDECGYNLDTPGAGFTECPGYTLEACEQVGDDEVANGLTRQHPRRFGGKPAIRPGRVA